jgi:hypothetical protein
MLFLLSDSAHLIVKETLYILSSSLSIEENVE